MAIVSDPDDSALAILQSDMSNYLQTSISSNAVETIPSHTIPSSHSLSTAPSDFRRPETQDPTDFWYCTPEKWSSWLDQIGSTDLRAVSSAATALRVHHVAGLLMETEEGVDVDPPCNACARQSKYTPCRTYANKKSSRCAYCINKHRSHCFSGPLLDPRIRAYMSNDVAARESSVESSPQIPRGADSTNTKRHNSSTQLSNNVAPNIPSTPTTSALQPFKMPPQPTEAAPSETPLPRFRRPQTDNTADFWYCSIKKWDELHLHYATAIAEGRATAYRVLQLFNKAGRLMETSEGVDAETPCDACARAGVVCRFSVTGKVTNERCAFCKMKYRKCNISQATTMPTAVEEFNAEQPPRIRPSDVLVRSDVPHSGVKRKRLEDINAPQPTTTISSSSPVGDDTDATSLPPSSNDAIKILQTTVASLQKQIMILQARDTAREAELNRQSRRVKLMAQNMQRVGSDLS